MKYLILLPFLIGCTPLIDRDLAEINTLIKKNNEEIRKINCILKIPKGKLTKAEMQIAINLCEDNDENQ